MPSFYFFRWKIELNFKRNGCSSFCPLLTYIFSINLFHVVLRYAMLGCNLLVLQLFHIEWVWRHVIHRTEGLHNNVTTFLYKLWKTESGVWQIFFIVIVRNCDIVYKLWRISCDNNLILNRGKVIECLLYEFSLKVFIRPWKQMLYRQLNSKQNEVAIEFHSTSGLHHLF